MIYIVQIDECEKRLNCMAPDQCGTGTQGYIQHGPQPYLSPTSNRQNKKTYI